MRGSRKTAKLKRSDRTRNTTRGGRAGDRMSSMNTLIVEAGGAGGYFGGRLAQALSAVTKAT